MTYKLVNLTLPGNHHVSEEKYSFWQNIEKEPFVLLLKYFFFLKVHGQIKTSTVRQSKSAENSLRYVTFRTEDCISKNTF